jgi:hypothetical protein
MVRTSRRAVTPGKEKPREARETATMRKSKQFQGSCAPFFKLLISYYIMFTLYYVTTACAVEAVPGVLRPISKIYHSIQYNRIV